MGPSFHNTIHMTGRKAQKYNTMANDQENAILAIMRQAREASPWEIWYLYNRIYMGKPLMYPVAECVAMMRRWSAGQWAAALQQIGVNDTPITSIRRAMTNLTNRGNLVKTDAQVTGAKGKPEYIWKIKQTSI